MLLLYHKYTTTPSLLPSHMYEHNSDGLIDIEYPYTKIL